MFSVLTLDPDIQIFRNDVSVDLVSIREGKAHSALQFNLRLQLGLE